MADGMRGDACDWYLLNFLCEIFFVVLFSYFLHYTVKTVAERNDILVLQSGVYLSIHDA
jgi:hypothetical protein